MRIAITSGPSNEDSEKIPSFFKKFLQLAESNPDHTFIFIFDRPYIFTFPENVVIIFFGPKKTSPLKCQLWWNMKIPFYLKKYQADILVSEKIISSTTKVPQILVSPELSFFKRQSFLDKKFLRFYKKNNLLFLEKAAQIIVNSEFSKQNIVSNYQTSSKKIKVVFQEIDNRFSPLALEEKELIKQKYTDGNEFFIYKGIVGNQENLVNLLKAFSFFKKWQKSSMQLIIAGEPGSGYAEFIESFNHFRFHNEVKILNLPNDEMMKVVAAAYAMVFIPLSETPSVAPLEAMKCEVPVVCSSIGELTELCGDAALIANVNDFKDVAEKMILLFRDEDLKNKMVQKGIENLKEYQKHEMPSMFFDTILKAAKRKPAL
jgi:glycosyltransferase involved in cell wall biosynthesis